MKPFRNKKCGLRNGQTATLLVALVLSLLAVPLLAGAQQPGKVPRIGVLSPGDPQSIAVKTLRQALQDLGYIEGKTIILDYRYAEWKLDRLPGLAEELVRLQPDVIFTHTTPGVLAARQATKTIPIVIGLAGDFVERGVVASLARPGGNITGLTLMDRELDPKRLQLLKEAVPSVSRVAVLVNPANPGYKDYPESLAPAAQSLGLRLQRVEARDPTDFEGALLTAAKDRAEALLIVNDAFFFVNRKLIGEGAAKRRLPSASGVFGFAQDGGLIAYGPSPTDMARRAAVFVDKILKGAKPADLPVEQPTKFELVINLKAAKTLGLTIPQSLLLLADEVIQ